ncbi:MAG: periplasmic heavy metal sensor [Bacteroidetes bacterium]|nr:periplasmic heavy metal sensor [Bacteroidota bacterium]
MGILQNNNRWLSIITLLLLTLNIVTLGYLWTHKNGGTPPPPPPVAGQQGQVFEFVTQELQLDSAQKESYKKLRDQHHAGQQPLQDSIKKAKDDFFELLKQQPVSDAAVKEAASKVSAAEEQLALFTFHHFQQLRAICTPVQQQKFDSIIQDVLHRFAPVRRPGPPPPGMRDGKLPPPPEGGDGPPKDGPPPPGKD